MKREPLFLYFFRLAVYLAILFFVLMLYWSSLLLESRLQDLQKQIEEKACLAAKSAPFSSTQVHSFEKSEWENLLEPDPFYDEVLPALLPENFEPQGVFEQAIVSRPDNLHPFSNWLEVSSWTGQCSLSVGRQKFGRYETLTPYAAHRMEERAPGEYWIYLREGMFWQPLQKEMFSEEIGLASHFMEKQPVTAADFKFYFDALMNPYVESAGAVSLRSYLSDIEEIKLIDDLTFVVRWKKNGEKVKYGAQLLTAGLSPLPRFVYQYFADGTKIISGEDYAKSSVFAQNFNDHFAKNVIVSCGPWIFDRMSDQAIYFRRNGEHFFPLDALMQKQVITFKSSPENIWQDFKAGEVDSYHIRPDQVAELATFLKSPMYKQEKYKINQISYLDRSYSYIGWNHQNPLFSSKKVRLAMTMAINRKRIVEQVLKGLGEEVTGPFFKNSPSYDLSIKPWDYSKEDAIRLLEEEGWFDKDGSGVRKKELDGKEVLFDFSLTYYVKNSTTKAVCEYIATALHEIGVRCRLNGVDVADLSALFDEKSFDAIALAWALGTPPEDPNQLWSSRFAKERGSSNAVGFMNQEADAIIVALASEKDLEKRRSLYHAFHAILHEEQPYTFLYSPKRIFLYRDYLKNVFLPVARQDLLPGANVAEPQSNIFWIKK